MNKVLFLSPNLGLGGGGAERQIVTVASLLNSCVTPMVTSMKIF